MGMSFDDLPDEAPKAPKATAMSFDDLPDEPSQALPGTEANTSFGTLNRDPSGAVVGNQPTAAPVQGPWLDVPNEPGQGPQSSSIDPAQLYYGAARSVDNMGLAAGRVLGKPASQAIDWAASQFTDQPTTAAQDFVKDKLGQLQARADSLAPAPDASLGNKLMNATGGLAGNLAAMAATGGLSRAPALAEASTSVLPGVVNQVGQATRTMAVPAITDAVNTGHDVYQQTGDLTDAFTASAAAGAADVAMGLLPASLQGNLATRAATGAPLGVLTGEGARQLRNAALPDSMQTPFTPEDAVVNGLTGAALGGALGRTSDAQNPQARFDAMMQRLTQKPAAQAPDAQATTAAQGPEPQATPALPIVEAPAQPQAVPAQPVAQPFAKSADINPLLDNLGVQGDARAKTLDLLRPAEAEVDTKRRGVLPMAEQQRLASLIGLQGPQADHFARQIGQAHNAETIIAMTNGVSDRLQNVLEQQQRIASGEASDIDKAEFVQSIAGLRGVFGDLMGARAESGRALAAQRRQVYNIRHAQDILESIGGANSADDLAIAIGKAVQSGGIGNAAKLINSPDGKAARLFGFYYRSGLLSGIRTHAVNIASNSITLGNEVIERTIAAGIGGAKRAAGSNGQTVFAEPIDLLIGMAKGSSKAGAAAVGAFRTGDSPMLGGGKQETSTADNLNRPRPAGAMATAGWAVEKLASLPYRALGAEDAFFATLNYEAELRALARQTALAEKKLGQLPAGAKLSQRIEQLVQDPTPGMIESAGEHARTQTFNNKAGAFAQAIMSVKAKVPWLNLIVPFVRTPANIVKFGLKRTPIAPAFKEVREDIMAGGAKQERAIARILWGSSVMVAAGMAAQAGYITGAGPDDKKEKAALLASGWRPYSIKVGDTYYDYSRLDPFSQWLGLASDMATQDYTHKGAGDIAANLLGSVVNNTVNKTYMQGLSNFIEFLDDPKRNGPWYLRQMGGTVAQPFTLLSNAASEGDTVGREQNSVLDAIKYRLPGLRSTLPEKLDAFGAPVPNRTYPGGPFSIAAPIAQSEQSQDPVRREAARLGWQPSVPDKAITLKGTKHELNDDQHHEMRQLVGRFSYDVAKRVMSAPGWKSLGDDQRRELLDKATAKARAAVRMAFVPLVATGNRTAIDKLSKAIQGESK